MRGKTKVCAVTAAVFLACLLALMPNAAGAGSITLTPTAQAPGASVSVAGTGFGATKNVGIVFGGEAQMVLQPFTAEIFGPDTRGYNFSRGPIKPGSFHLHLVAIAGTFQGASYDYSDDGNGNILRDTTQAIWATVNYALGGYVHNSTATIGDYEYCASYTYYQYNVTSFGRVTTTATGTFSANFTVPSVANGSYNVTAIDSSGNMATATLNVSSSIPEILPFGAILLLSSVAVAASARHFRARPKIS